MIKEIIIVGIGILILASIHRKRILELENKIEKLEFMLSQKIQVEFIKQQQNKNNNKRNDL